MPDTPTPRLNFKISQNPIFGTVWSVPPPSKKRFGWWVRLNNQYLALYPALLCLCLIGGHLLFNRSEIQAGWRVNSTLIMILQEQSWQFSHLAPLLFKSYTHAIVVIGFCFYCYLLLKLIVMAIVTPWQSFRMDSTGRLLRGPSILAKSPAAFLAFDNDDGSSLYIIDGQKHIRLMSLMRPDELDQLIRQINQQRVFYSLQELPLIETHHTLASGRLRAFLRGDQGHTIRLREGSYSFITGVFAMCCLPFLVLPFQDSQSSIFRTSEFVPFSYLEAVLCCIVIFMLLFAMLPRLDLKITRHRDNSLTLWRFMPRFGNMLTAAEIEPEILPVSIRHNQGYILSLASKRSIMTLTEIEAHWLKSWIERGWEYAE